MIRVSDVLTLPPAVFASPLQQQAYETLVRLGIPFSRVENDPAVTMEDCRVIDEKLRVQVAKSLFLCNRQQTDFFLFVTRGDKPFRTAAISRALGVSRLSFAPPEKLLAMLGAVPGAAGVMGLLADPAGAVQLVLDREVVQLPFFSCTDTTTTGYLRMATRDMTEVYLPHVRHTPVVIDV